VVRPDSRAATLHEPGLDLALSIKDTGAGVRMMRIEACSLSIEFRTMKSNVSPDHAVSRGRDYLIEREPSFTEIKR
jgi:hypothetical protein